MRVTVKELPAILEEPKSTYPLTSVVLYTLESVVYPEVGHGSHKELPMWSEYVEFAMFVLLTLLRKGVIPREHYRAFRKVAIQVVSLLPDNDMLDFMSAVNAKRQNDGMLTMMQAVHVDPPNLGGGTSVAGRRSSGLLHAGPEPGEGSDPMNREPDQTND